MARYWVPITNSCGTSVLVEADSPEQAAANVWESDAFQNQGGLCHACESNVGALGDWDLVTDKPTVTDAELVEIVHARVEALAAAVSYRLTGSDEGADLSDVGACERDLVATLRALLDRPADPLPHITLDGEP